MSLLYTLGIPSRRRLGPLSDWKQMFLFSGGRNPTGFMNWISRDVSDIPCIDSTSLCRLIKIRARNSRISHKYNVYEIKNYPKRNIIFDPARFCADSLKLRMKLLVTGSFP